MTNHNIKRALYVGVLLIVALNTFFAQNAGKISGVVTDAQTGEALIGTNIVILGTSLGGSTDLEGAFFILNVPAGKYNLQASMMGYEKVILQDVIVNSNRTAETNFKLKSAEIEQEAVIVEATRPDVEPEKTSTSAIIRPEDVQGLAGIRDVGDVIGLAADVTDGHFRGGRTNEELYTLQGSGIMNPLDNSSAFLPIMSAVEEIEVITSGFGAQYGNAQSGVVNITMKEGKSDKWRATFESRMRLPGRDHWGPSVFDESANPYLQKLADTSSFWFHGDASNGNAIIFGWTGATNSSTYAGDTAMMIQAAKVIWGKATGKDLNSNYGNRIDYSVEASAGGPLDDGVTMFLALRSNVSNAILPTENPDEREQIMGNIAFDLGNGAALKVNGGYQYQFTNVFGSGSGFYQWIWDRILGIQYRKQTNHQLGIRFTKAVSPRTFYDIKLNVLRTENRQGSSPWYDVINNSVRNMETGTAIITRTGNFMFYTPMTGKAFFVLGNNISNFTNERTGTISLDASFTSQISKSHLLNGGIQGNYYVLKVDNIGSIASKGSITAKNYSGEPWNLGVFFQDKMEFQGMIANVGLRWDIWSSNNSYYTYPFNPFAIRDSAGNATLVQDPNLAAKTDAKPIGRLEPRIGISFPVSVTTVFHLNYGSFLQAPAYQYVIGNQVKMNPTSVDVNTMANPRLSPQTTDSYDIGVMQGLGDGFTLDVSGWYKDVKDLIEQASYIDESSGATYNSYFNRDYADIRGFRVALTKKRGRFTGSINYQYSVATGKSASASNAPMTIKLTGDGTLNTDITKVPVKDVILNFDRTHNLIINFGYVTSDQWGPKILKAYPLSNMVFSVNSFARSGRPYTPSSHATDINTLRTPAEYNTNIRISKAITNFFGSKATIYAEVFNLFNNKILSYSYIFNVANKIDPNLALARYETYPVNDINNGLRYYDDQTDRGTYAVDHSFMMYDNAPRAFNFGIAFEL